MDAINATNIGEVSRTGHQILITVNEDRSNRVRWRQKGKNMPWTKIDEPAVVEEGDVTLPSRPPTEVPLIEEAVPPAISRGSSTSTLASPPDVEINYANATCSNCAHLFSDVPERSVARYCRKCGVERELLPPDSAQEPSPIEEALPLAADYGEEEEEAPCT